ncbi:helix-turn-helix domain-containing protein [Amorphus sp. 3PC139-8]|uniref:helix-turn-helix domain-containing protein n=1 Tax=Amorphus sp. 3PC139-8 TaxID=2735676 RepID=UPI00345CC1F7
MTTLYSARDTDRTAPAAVTAETTAWEALRASIRSKTVRLAEHTIIYYESDPADRFFEIVDGAVMLFKLLPDGRRQVVGLFGPGDLFGLPSGEDHDSAAETLVPSVLKAIERRDIEDSVELQRHVNRCLLRQVADLREHTVLLGRKSAFERVASYLMHMVPGRGLGERCRGRPESGCDEAVVRITMTRQEIADYLGLTIETVSRIISGMKRKGFLTADRQDRLKITDVCALCRQSGMH